MDWQWWPKVCRSDEQYHSRLGYWHGPRWPKHALSCGDDCPEQYWTWLGLRYDRKSFLIVQFLYFCTQNKFWVGVESFKVILIKAEHEILTSTGCVLNGRCDLNAASFCVGGGLGFGFQNGSSKEQGIGNNVASNHVFIHQFFRQILEHGEAHLKGWTHSKYDLSGWSSECKRMEVFFLTSEPF